MAQFFQTNDLSCPKCGNTVLADRMIGLYSPSQTEEGAMKFDPIARQIYCTVCGAEVKRVAKITKD